MTKKEARIYAKEKRLLLEQQDDVVRDASCDQHGILVVAERVAVVLDDDDFHCFHLLSGQLPHIYLCVGAESRTKSALDAMRPSGAH